MSSYKRIQKILNLWYYILAILKDQTVKLTLITNFKVFLPAVWMVSRCLAYKDILKKAYSLATHS